MRTPSDYCLAGEHTGHSFELAHQSTSEMPLYKKPGLFVVTHESVYIQCWRSGLAKYARAPLSDHVPHMPRPIKSRPRPQGIIPMDPFVTQKTPPPSDKTTSWRLPN